MASVPVQTRIDASVKERAGIVLGNMGLTVSDAIRILLTRISALSIERHDIGGSALLPAIRAEDVSITAG